ncbi:MAG: AraC family transcriptional regulator [bacterium]|nr:AraC family transcriptional regulator [bacterium]
MENITRKHIQYRWYKPKNPILKRLIKYFYSIESDSIIHLKHKILPTHEVRISFNLSEDIITHEINNVKYSNGIFSSGIWNQPKLVNHNCKLNIIGFTIYPGAAYSLLKIPISEFLNKIINMDCLIKDFSLEIAEKTGKIESASKKIKVIEEELIKMIDPDYFAGKEIFHAMSLLGSKNKFISINQYCNEFGINQRRLERNFNKYIGMTPKQFQKSNRFQNMMDKLILNKYPDLIDLAYDRGYYDQAHFIHDFKTYTGESPKQFMLQYKHLNDGMKDKNASLDIDHSLSLSSNSNLFLSN